MSWLQHPHSRRRVMAATAGLVAGATLPAMPAAAATTAQQEQFTNPVIWQDFADLEVIRVGDTYYYTGSTMHYSPGAPVLRSYDLVNWEFIGHSVPVLDFGDAYDLNGGRAYVGGIWASSMRYRPSDETFYWLGQIGFQRSYVYSATDAAGPWTRHAEIGSIYYDAGLLFDDDTPYVAYGANEIHVAQLAPDMLTEVRSEHVLTKPDEFGLMEGSRFYKINGNYYIFVTRPADGTAGQYIWKSTSGPFGPYEMREVLWDLPRPIPGGGVPHQGALVDTPNGDWYHMGFIDAYPGGRVPALAPVTWNAEGWPELQTVDGEWGQTYPYPVTPHPLPPMTGADTFEGTALAPYWEWNHNPDTAAFTVDNGLTLRTATVTDDLYNARNTLTRRIQGPASTATVVLDCSGMADGDRAGLAMLRDSSAWIGVTRQDGVSRLVMFDGLTMDAAWNTTRTGTEQAGADLPASGSRVWLRAAADISPGPGRRATFSYSTDGTTFTPLGPAFTMTNAWEFFLGYRFAVFNHATQALGGEVLVERFELSTP
ncbi:glycoside hydrolase family 43 protein [Streptomyces sp. NBC_01431]|uniref:glycoside hydrolase family 43 protein n=1 Tax=Streptomyces sp. NBC_01431 TaxID=2903863 RepID=UPI002E3559DD|nr:glycoside hydrolase 43 family protein [Streptomyces sp. NBC_01431]